MICYSVLIDSYIHAESEIEMVFQQFVKFNKKSAKVD